MGAYGAARLSLCLLAAALLGGCGSTEPPPAADAPVPPISPAIYKDGAPEDTLPAESVPAEAPPLPQPEAADFVRVKDYIPGIYVSLRYASDDNFTGQAIYGFTDAYLRYGTVEKLSAAQEILSRQGYSLLIWDAFRPVEAQFRLWDACPDPVYVANPETGASSHSRGNTVDVTSAAADGTAVAMPTDFDDFTPLADRDYRDADALPAANAQLLEDAMAACGFKPYSGEWWHFSDTDVYPVEETFAPPAEK